ncbi:hypothetical protein [Rubrivirga marina]|uniref:Uncharacterized protein n=1 Tax=Rubrivirga marina TaxID=1196024 RepID=A0A271J485_9BACT|nr:hypothetical protein [Rubrivirga marina]PAP78336.1 hypothetical protein BSZ37_18875 [Rubrivirga marina]
MSDRTYSEREIAAILARAAEGQRRGLDGEDAPGLTLSEIERAGTEAGLDPSLVRRAAADLDAGLLALDVDRPGTTVVERWVDAPLRLAVWEDAVAALQVRHGPGSADTLARAHEGASQEWTHTTLSGSRTTVTASPRGGRTRVRVVTVDGGSADPRWQSAVLAGVVGLTLGMLAGAGVAEGLGWGDFAGVAALLLTLAVVTAIGTPLLMRSTERRRARQAAEAERLADELARSFELGRSPEAPATESPAVEAAAEPQIDPSLLDASPEDDSVAGTLPAHLRRRDRS